jgi:hypothetical protein
MMLRELERVAPMIGGFANDDEIASWSRSYLVAVSKFLPPRPAAPTTYVPRRRSLLYGIAFGTIVLAALLARRGLQGEVPTVGARSAPSSEVVMPAAPTEPARDLIAAAPPSAASAGTPSSVEAKPHEGEERPPRKSRPAAAGVIAPHGQDRSAAEVAKEKCILDIGSEPAFAYVAIDGVKVGSTPIYGREVTPGSHRIQVWRDGLGSKTFNLEMRPGDRITRVVKLP